jgi:hypothetical protein
VDCPPSPPLWRRPDLRSQSYYRQLSALYSLRVLHLTSIRPSLKLAGPLAVASFDGTNNRFGHFEAKDNLIGSLQAFRIHNSSCAEIQSDAARVRAKRLFEYRSKQCRLRWTLLEQILLVK